MTNLRALGCSLSLLILVTLQACGGGGDGGGGSVGFALPPAADGGGTSASTETVDLKTFAGTYSLSSPSGANSLFSIDDAAILTACTVSPALSCKGQIRASTATAGTFTLAVDGETTPKITGTLEKGGAITAKSSDGELLTGSKVADTFAKCPADYVLNTTECAPPSNQLLKISPFLAWNIQLAPGGRKYALEICYGGLNNCKLIHDPIFVSNEDLQDADFPGILAYAEEVAKEYGVLLNRLWTAKTYPLAAQIEAIFRNSIETAIESDTRNAVETAVQAFADAGFPAAGGGAGGTVSETPPTTPLPLDATQPVGYLEIIDPQGHKEFSTDICTSWQVIGAPVRLSTCSYASGGGGYYVYENNTAPSTLCFTVSFKNGSTPQKGCYFDMPTGVISKGSCFSCGFKNGGAQMITLRQLGKIKYE